MENKTIEEHLTEDEKKLYNKMSAKKIIKLAKLSLKLTNSVCGKCQIKIHKRYKSIRDIDDLCYDCSMNKDVKDIFCELKKLYDSLWGVFYG